MESNIAPSISVSTSMWLFCTRASVDFSIFSVAFRAPAPERLEDPSDPDVASPNRHMYSRYTTPMTTRVESVLAALLVSVSAFYYGDK